MKHAVSRALLVAAGIAVVAGCGNSATDAGSLPSGAAGSGAAGSAAGALGVGGAVAGAATGGNGAAVAGSSGSTDAGGSAGAGMNAGGGTSGSGGAAGSAGAPAAGAGGAVAIDHNAAGVIVVLGSSTAAGTGPTNPANAWVERYRAYLKQEFPKFELTDLALGGYTTYQMQPSDFKPGGNLPLPDKARNITKALSLKPNAIIINMPTNDTANGYPAADQMANFERVTALAGQSGVSCWVTSTQPRNFPGDAGAQAKRNELMLVRDDIKQKYTDHTLDFWTGFAEDDGEIKPIYSAGDGTHMNDAAHALLEQQVVAAKIPEAALTAKH